MSELKYPCLRVLGKRSSGRNILAFWGYTYRTMGNWLMKKKIINSNKGRYVESRRRSLLSGFNSYGRHLNDIECEKSRSHDLSCSVANIICFCFARIVLLDNNNCGSIYRLQYPFFSISPCLNWKATCFLEMADLRHAAYKDIGSFYFELYPQYKRSALTVLSMF